MKKFITVSMMLLSFAGCSTLKSFSNENPRTTKAVIKTATKLVLEANEDKNFNLIEIESNLRLARLIVTNSGDFNSLKLKETLNSRTKDANVKFITNILIDYVNNRLNEFKDKSATVVLSIIDGVIEGIQDYQLNHIKT